ncbi:MAG: pilus assembly protein PilC [Phycisphaeraceae bacterium]|nr:pilus assembly protein PilC [Phycisphaeraceae bacterium]
MATFQYEALTDTGKPQKGKIVAASSDEAIARIRSQGYFPTSVREQRVTKGKGAKAAPAASETAKKKKKSTSINIGNVNGKALTAFTRQLSTLQDAGLPILRSLVILEQQQKPGLFKNILEEVHTGVSGGMTLSESMAAHPRAFNKLYCKMITAGEVGGVLDLILARLAEFMEKAAALKRKIIGAMIYPSVVLAVAAIIVLGIMVFIVPSFVKIFDDFDSALPIATTVLINTSKWIGGTLNESQVIPGWLWILASPVIIFFVTKMLRKTHLGQAVIDTAVLKIPIVGQLIAKTTVAKFARTLGTLINAGVPILDALTITRDTTANYVYAKALGEVHNSVRQGESFSEPLGKAKVCDAIVTNMIDVGEETGDLDKMLVRVADNYEEEVDVLVQALVSTLEPLMVVFLGGTVGFIVIALFLPLVKLIQAVI